MVTRVPTIFCISLCFWYVIELLMLISKMVLVFHLSKQTKTKTDFFIWHFLAVPSPSWRKVDNLVAIGRGLPIVLRACEFDSFSMSVKSWSIADLILQQQRRKLTRCIKIRYFWTLTKAIPFSLSLVLVQHNFDFCWFYFQTFEFRFIQGFVCTFREFNF